MWKVEAMRPSEWLPILHRARKRAARAAQETAQREKQEHLAALGRLSALAHDGGRDPAPIMQRPAHRPARLGDSPC